MQSHSRYNYDSVENSRVQTPSCAPQSSEGWWQILCRATAHDGETKIIILIMGQQQAKMVPISK